MYQFWHNTQRNAQLRKSCEFWVLPNHFPPTPRFSDVIWISKRIDDEKVVLTTFSLFCGESFDRKEEFSSVQRRRPPCLFPRSQVLVRGKSVACFGTGEGKGPCSSSETFNHPIYILESTVCIMSVISSEADSSGKCELSSKWSTHILTSKTSSGSPLASSYCWGLPSSSPLPWDGAHHPWDQQLCREVLSPSRSAP